MLDALRKYLHIQYLLNIEEMYHEYQGPCCQHWSYSALSRFYGLQNFVQYFIHFTLTAQLVYIHNIAIGLKWESDIII